MATANDEFLSLRSGGNDIKRRNHRKAAAAMRQNYPIILNNCSQSLYMPCYNFPTSSSMPLEVRASSPSNAFLTAPTATAISKKEIGTSVDVNSLNSMNNDLFVHVQPGEVLTIIVGNDDQHIAGPATVRMVNLAGMSPSALPLHVPPGHMVQQIVEQGILRHLILSPEPPPTSRLLNSAVHAQATANAGLVAPLKGYNHGSPSPPLLHTHLPPNVIVAQGISSDEYNHGGSHRNWSIFAKDPGAHTQSPHLSYSPADDIDSNALVLPFNEEEDWEQFTAILSKVQPPQILRIGAREADIIYQEIDQTEAIKSLSKSSHDSNEAVVSEVVSASNEADTTNNSQIPNTSAPSSSESYSILEQYEFTYDIVLFEGSGRIVSSYRCESDCGNRARLCRLKPNTDYYIQLRASLEELGLQGKPSKAIRFHTSSTYPDCPYPPRFISSTTSSVSISWKPAVDNGSKITSYRVQIAKESTGTYGGDGADYMTAYEGLVEQATVSNLKPSSKYRIRIIAINSEGESKPSAHIIAYTSRASAMWKPDIPNVVSISSNSIRLSWNVVPNHLYTLEMSEFGHAGKYIVVREKIRQSFAAINELISNRQYYFRLFAYEEESGYSEPSEVLIARTYSPSSPSSSGVIAAPSRPFVIVYDGINLEIGWRGNQQTSDKDVMYVVEGSSAAGSGCSLYWAVVYKGTNTTLLVKNQDLCAFRVAACKSNLQSPWSGVLRIRKDLKKSLTAPGICTTPSVSETSEGCLKVEWEPLRMIQQPSSVVLLYQLNRVNTEPAKIIFQGEATSYEIEDCLPGEEVEVQVRALVKSSYGATAMGEWSRIGVGRKSLLPPSPPIDVYVDDHLILHWKSPLTTYGSPISKYIVRRSRVVLEDNHLDNSEEMSEDWTTLSLDGDVYQLGVGDGRPGCKYELNMLAVSAGGTSDSSKCAHVLIPPSVPSAPASFHVLPQGCDQLKLSWTASSSTGSSLTGYVLKIEDDQSIDMIQEMKFAADSVENECVVRNLEPDHSYKVSIFATNAIGHGEASSAVVSTLALPPVPPQLLCSEVGSNYLKLKWRLNESYTCLPNLYYYLEKENGNGKFSPIYEGDNRYVKVRNLNESTKYRFRIRCSSRASGAGPWSQPFEFATEQVPPPAIRTAPSVVEVGCGIFQAEWLPLRTVSSTVGRDTLMYRLQLAPRISTDKSNSWKTIYQGPSTSYSFSSSDAAQVRVQCIRTRDGIESVSVPSAVQFVRPSSVTSNHEGMCGGAVSNCVGATSTQWIEYHIFSDANYALLILMSFIALAISLALSIDALFFSGR